MIITALIAKDFRKYERLQLENLPARGILAITGMNESGKSSIGDAIQFALFGCTSQLNGAEIAKLIRWGCPQASVSLKLQQRGHAYHLIRSVNQDGDTVATLFSGEEGTTLADTPETVEKQLKALFGYNHKTFDQAFYWNQQSLQTTPSDSEQLLAVAGLREYAQLNAQLQTENHARIQTIVDMNAQRKTLQTHYEQAYVDDARLGELERVGTHLEQRQQYFLQLAQRIDKESESYAHNHSQIQQLITRSSKVNLWTKISVLLFLLMLLTGLCLLFAPTLGSVFLSGMDNALREMLGRTTIRVAAFCALISAGMLIYGWFLEMRRVRPLHQQSDNLADTLLEGFSVTNTPANEQIALPAAHYILQTQTDIPVHSSEHPDIAVIPEWAKSVRDFSLNPSHVQSAADVLNISMESRNREFGKYLRSLHLDMDKQQTSLNQRDNLQAQLDQQEHDLEHIRRDRVVFDTAIDLLQRSASQSITRFNQLVRQRCGTLLQRFTFNHYRSLELKHDFTFKVLSEDKGDYLEFDEISAGTQRQIALAMQVAIANALADNTHATAQMLFLDEPLAFFDPERTNSTLKCLQESSQSAVTQIWLTAQTLPQGIEFTRIIQCPQNSRVLSA